MVANGKSRSKTLMEKTAWYKLLTYKYPLHTAISTTTTIYMHKFIVLLEKIKLPPFIGSKNMLTGI